MDIFFQIVKKDSFQKHHQKRMEIWCCEFRILNVYIVFHDKISNLHYDKNYNCIQLETPSVDIPLIYLNIINNKSSYGKFLTTPNFKQIKNCCHFSLLVDLKSVV